MANPRVPSTTSFLSVSDVAELAAVPRQTLYTWIARGVITPEYDVSGGSIFTPAEAKQVKRIAEERREARNVLRLPQKSGT